jgi:hypothetical protein
MDLNLSPSCTVTQSGITKGVYWCFEGYCNEAWDMFYVNLGVVSITYTFRNGLAIMQPTIGWGVFTLPAFQLIYLFVVYRLA